MPDHDIDCQRVAAGHIRMICPKEYGGHARHPLERYIILEELLATGAPVGAHWIADPQTGQLLLRYSMQEQREKYLPEMTRGIIRLYRA
jgi:alkylation response protein AidB-like acyl-CoA dehydrogenase